MVNSLAKVAAHSSREQTENRQRGGREEAGSEAGRE